MEHKVEKWVKCDILPVDLDHLITLRLCGPPQVLGALLNLWVDYAYHGPIAWDDEQVARVAGFDRWPSESVRRLVLKHFEANAEGHLVPKVVSEWVAKRQAVRLRASRASDIRWKRQKRVA